MDHREDIHGYVPNSKWYYRHYLGREFLIQYWDRGQMTRPNYVSLYDTATETNEHYTTDNGRPVPKKVYRHLVRVLEAL